ncbi:hypothetical protein [Desulfosporosinus sp. SYSU MS00001]|uniref:hypothetical protein n=1 Tax=Desulfosporosinus sp. SYSU MS00001 TaxID=3416284 RepID=UPI003CE899D1
MNLACMQQMHKVAGLTEMKDSRLSGEASLTRYHETCILGLLEASILRRNSVFFNEV